MPRKEDIEKFKEVVNSLGGEPEIAARKSQSIEDVLPPEEIAQAPAEQPPVGGRAPTGEQPPLRGGGQPAAPEEPAGDFGLDLSGLEDLGLEQAEVPGPGAAEEAPQATPPEAEEAGLDFGSLFGEETGGPPIEEPEQPAPEAGIDEAAPGLPEIGEISPEEFTLPESEAGPLKSDLAQMEVLPEEPAEAEAPPVEAPPAGAEEMPPAETPSEEALAGIELPNLEDLSLTEPLAGIEEQVAESPAEMEQPAPEPAAAPPQAEIPSLEDFDLGQAVEPEAPAPAPPEEPAAEAPAPQVPEEGLGDLGLEGFSFQEPAGEFAAEAEAPAQPEVQPARPARPARPAAPAEEEGAPLPELGGAEAEIALTEDQFNRLKETLEGLPRNLKIAVQDVIGDGRAAGAALARLVSLLVAGASAQQIAAATGRITGRRIAIPAGYEKKSGVAFEAEQRTFAYAFRENIVPLLRLFALTILAAVVVGFLGYRLVYRPLYAAANYRIGYTNILGDRFTLANESFDRARAVVHLKKWYYRYAEAFANKRQFVLAEQKYEQLLQDFPGDHQGILDYARLESTRLADYSKANDLLKRILDKSPYDQDALLAAGDNNLDWAATDATRYEAARLDYATLIEKYGTRDEFLFRMMRYFIRTNDAQDIERLRLYFAQRPGVRVDPYVYAELGGYLIDHRQLDHAQEVLFRAEDAKENLAEIHYNLARYYRLTQRPDDEMLALKNTVALLSPRDPLTPKRIAMEVDTHARLGELYDVKGQYIDAEKEFVQAIGVVEENQKNNLISTGGVFGRPYADLGDLHYYIIGDLDMARSLYQKAVDHKYFDPALDYKIGFTEYAGGDYAAALDSFMKAENEWGLPRDPDAPPPFVPSANGPVDYSGKPPVNLLYSIGNTFYLRGDYFAAQGYYLRVRDRLNARRAAIGELLPQEKPEHRSLLETLVKVDNNLGVDMDMLAARTGDRNRRSEALVYLAEAAETADLLTRSPDSRSTGGTRNLPYLNQRGILYPVSGFVPQISRDIPKDPGTLFW